MKNLKALLVMLVVCSFNFSMAADKIAPAVSSKMEKLAKSDKTIGGLFQGLAERVELKASECKLEFKAIDGSLDDFNNNKTVTGSFELRQICSNAEMDGASNGLVKGTIANDRVLIDSVVVNWSGF